MCNIRFWFLLLARAVRNRFPLKRDLWKRASRTCVVARRLEVVTVAELLLISWCVLGAAGFRYCFFRLFFLERTWPAASMRPPCLVYSICEHPINTMGFSTLYDSVRTISLYSWRLVTVRTTTTTSPCIYTFISGHHQMEILQLILKNISATGR